MPLSRNQYNEIMKILSERKATAEMSAQARRDELSYSLPAINKYSEEIQKISARELKARLSKDIVSAHKLCSRRKELVAKKLRLIQDAGYPRDYLKVHYSCKKCRDTGFIGKEKCGCFKKLESELLNRQSGLPMLMERENFASLDVNVYDRSDYLDELYPQTITQYQYMTMPGGVIDTVKAFVQNFDEVSGSSILMFGPPGTGKTFLTNCLAKALIEKQHSVSYERAGDMFDRMNRLNFSREVYPEDEGRNRRIFESELLIIDDLGTEFATEFTRARLFSIVSNRLSNGKSTIISTNLSMNQIKECYGERVSSRLMGDYILLPFYGGDLRIVKGRLSAS